MSNQDNILSFSSGKYMTQPETLAVELNQAKLTIGLPKEISEEENRVALLTDTINLLIENGHRVLLQSGAGLKSNITDNSYSEAGAQIVKTAKEIYQSDIIIKIFAPTLQEIELFRGKQYLFSSLHRQSQSKEYYLQLMRKKITALHFEGLKEENGSFPVVRSMSEIAGNTSVIIAAEYLSDIKNGKGIVLGGFPGIPSAKVIIIGAGTVAEYATKTALGMGADVKVFDDSVFRLRRLQHTIKEKIFTSIIQTKRLTKELQTADVLIGAVKSNEGIAPCIVTEMMVEKMEEGSVIIDVSIDQGGCVETSRLTKHSNPVFKKYGVTHYCVPNIPSKVPYTASMALSNYFGPLLLSIAEKGGVSNLIKSSPGFRNGVYLLNGILTKESIGYTFGIPYQNIELLLAANF